MNSLAVITVMTTQKVERNNENWLFNLFCHEGTRINSSPNQVQSSNAALVVKSRDTWDQFLM